MIAHKKDSEIIIQNPFWKDDHKQEADSQGSSFNYDGKDEFGDMAGLEFKTLMAKKKQTGDRMSNLPLHANIEENIKIHGRRTWLPKTTILMKTR